MKVLLADRVAPGCSRILREAGLEVADRPGLEPGRLREALAGAAGLIVRSATRVDADLLGAAHDLKVIGRAGTGVDNIDVEAATLRGVVVMNAPGENTISAAEHTLAMLLALCRNVSAADASLRRGEWQRSGFVGVELYGKTLGVIGLGRIGRAVAERARAFGLEILAHDPFLPAEAAAGLGIELLPLDALFERSDFLTLHVPLAEGTRHLIGAEAFGRCKPGVRIVNCARGGLVDEAALLRALDSGRVAGAALDVYETEPLPANHALRSHAKVVLTPHLGATTVEAQDKVAARIAEQVADFLKTGSVRNAVNMPSLEPAAASRLQPYQKLAEAVGLLQARLLRGNFQELGIALSGDVIDLPLRAISSAVLKGFLGGVLSQPVNLVNAEALARSHGFSFTESRSNEPTDYASLITLTLRSSEGERVIAGALFGNRFPRIVRIDRFVVDAKPKGEMLLVSNDDVPGMLARISAAIAGGGVNIASLSLGRDRGTGKALAVFNLDAPLASDSLEAVRGLPGVDGVLAVRLPR